MGDAPIGQASTNTSRKSRHITLKLDTTPVFIDEAEICDGNSPLTFEDDHGGQHLESLSGLISSNYNGIKSALSRSRSQCLKAGSSAMTTTSNDIEVSQLFSESSGILTSKEIAKIKSTRVKNKSTNLAPIIRGLSVYKAKLIYNTMYPFVPSDVSLSPSQSCNF